jgi:hypothetical protein
VPDDLCARFRSPHCGLVVASVVDNDDSVGDFTGGAHDISNSRCLVVGRDPDEDVTVRQSRSGRTGISYAHRRTLSSDVRALTPKPRADSSIVTDVLWKVRYGVTSL